MWGRGDGGWAEISGFGGIDFFIIRGLFIVGDLR